MLINEEKALTEFINILWQKSQQVSNKQNSFTRNIELCRCMSKASLSLWQTALFWLTDLEVSFPVFVPLPPGQGETEYHGHERMWQSPLASQQMRSRGKEEKDTIDRK